MKGYCAGWGLSVKYFPCQSLQSPAGFWSTRTSTFRWAAVAQHSNAAFWLFAGSESCATVFFAGSEPQASSPAKLRRSLICFGQVPAGLRQTGTSAAPFSPEGPTAVSSREACASTRGPGIQAFGVMPPEGVDSDCVWIEPALDVMLFWFDRLDSGAPSTPRTRCARPRGPRLPGMTRRGGVEDGSGFRGPHSTPRVRCARPR